MKSKFLMALNWVISLYGLFIISGTAFLSWHLAWNSELMPRWGAIVFFLSSTSTLCISIYRILIDNIRPRLKNTFLPVLLPTVGIMFLGTTDFLVDTAQVSRIEHTIEHTSGNQLVNMFDASVADIVFTVIPVLVFLVTWMIGVNCAVSGEKKKIEKPRIRVPAYVIKVDDDANTGNSSCSGKI